MMFLTNDHKNVSPAFHALFLLVCCCLLVIIWFTFDFQTLIYIHNYYHAMLFDEIKLNSSLFG